MRLSTVLLLTSLLYVSQCSAVIFFVEPDEVYCLGEEMGFDVLVHGSFKRIGGPTKKLKVMVFKPKETQKALWEKHAADEGTFGFTTDKHGQYKFCFTYLTSDRRDNPIEVEFTLKSGFEAKDYTEVARLEHLKPIEVELLKLQDITRQLYDDMLSLRRREARHRVTSDSTNTAVFGWSFVSLSITVVLGLYQTWWLKRFLKRKKLL